MTQAEVILLPYKGEEKADLAGLRQALIDRLCPPSTPVVYFDMPLRDPTLPYLEAVDLWHDEIARRWTKALDAHPNAQRAALLIWGDPSLYDSSLRIAARLDAPVNLHVIPGITSLQLLTAAHCIPLNTLGGEVLITTGRQLRTHGWPQRVESLAVMLDGGCAFQSLALGRFDIWWGAYLGMAEQLLHAGPLDVLCNKIIAQRRRARERHGWIMDIYLLRVREGSQ